MSQVVTRSDRVTVRIDIGEKGALRLHFIRHVGTDMLHTAVTSDEGMFDTQAVVAALDTLNAASVKTADGF